MERVRDANVDAGDEELLRRAINLNPDRIDGACGGPGYAGPFMGYNARDYKESDRAFAGSVPTIGDRSGPAHGQGFADGHHAGFPCR